MSATNLLADIRTLYHLLAAPISGADHASRLESFYARQAQHYDRFRERLLNGRRELCQSLPLTPGQVWLDLGGGTGALLEFAADRVPSLKQVLVADLSPSLLEMARSRVRANGWQNVSLLEADVTTLALAEPVDVVTFSYSLTMIPDWMAAIERAWELLRPGGVIGVADFYVSRKYPDAGRVKHGWLQRTLWPTWFNCDNVFLSPDHLPWLARRFEQIELVETQSRIPWLPLVRVPCYRFIGRKPMNSGCRKE